MRRHCYLCASILAAHLACLSCLPVESANALQAVYSGNGHIHDLHPTTWHGPGPDRYKRIYLSDGAEHGEPRVELVGTDVDILFGEWMVNNTCQPETKSITRTRARTHEVRIGASETIGANVDLAAYALFAKLKAKAHASVTFDQSWTGTYEDISQVTTERTVYPCQQLYFYAWKMRYRAEGTITLGSHKIICECMMHAKPATSYCNKVTLHGTGVGWDSYGSEWVQRGLTDPCPCANVEDGTEAVMEPAGPGVIPPLKTGNGNGS